MCREFHLSTVTLLLLLPTVLTSLEKTTTLEAGLLNQMFPSQCSATCPWTTETDLVEQKQNTDANSTQPQINNAPKEWCAGVDFQEPVVNMKLAPCKNITLAGSEFAITSQGKVKVSRDKWMQVFEEFSLSDDNKTVNVCFRLSPQLLQCTLKRLDRRLYSYSTSLLALRNCRAPKDVIGIRDFYTSPDSRDVFSCDVPIGNARSQRCNNIDFELSEVEIASDNSSLRILSSNVVINWPEYSVLDAAHIRLCYPMSPEMTTCNLWEFKPHEFTVTADHRLFNSDYNRYFDPGEFVFKPGGGAYFCKPANLANTSPDPFFTAMAFLQIVSAVFVVVAFVIHLLVPSLNYHAKPLLCHMSSTAVMYICASIRRLVFPIPFAGCYSIFVIFYFASMSSFFWISVLAFDLWSIFAGMQASSRLSCAVNCDKSRKFAYYALYAYGIPLLLVAFSVVVDTQESLQTALSLHPAIQMMCWFNERKSALVLCYIPLLIVFVANIVLFVLTVLNLRGATKDAKIVNKKRNKQLLFVCIKIFCIMGLFSIIELVTVMVDARGKGTYLAEISSSIQGILLFVIYICKPATYRILRKKFCPISSTATRTGCSKNNTRDSNTSGISMESVLADDSTPYQKKDNLPESSGETATDMHAEATV